MLNKVGARMDISGDPVLEDEHSQATVMENDYFYNSHAIHVAKNLAVFNKELLAKQGWRLIWNKAECLASQVFEEYLLPKLQFPRG
ncbi:hypothetical protein ACOSQ3_016228 [Xanthoceras sorbifolium]